jgi:hypothetical protein
MGHFQMLWAKQPELILLCDTVDDAPPPVDEEPIAHSCCGSQVVERSTVVFRCEQLVFRDQREDDVVTVYLISYGVMTCKVGFLPAHLNHCARDYDGLVACVVSVYSDRCTNLVKWQKFRRNFGCCTAKILGEMGMAGATWVVDESHCLSEGE